MKIAVITDTHFGVRNDNRFFLDYFERFYSDVFFPTLKKHGVSEIIHAGDLVDRRKYINYWTLNRMKHMFLKPIDDLGIPMKIILGNHDVYFKNTNNINALAELLSDSEMIQVIDQPEVQNFDGLDIALMPWLNAENLEDNMEFIEFCNAPFLVGHLELNGFEMHGGAICNHGMNPSVFSKFEKVLSGHFHHKSKQKNIQYLGSPYEMTWSDYGDMKGFYILDTETREMEFVPNPIRMFEKIFYVDSGKTMEQVLDFDPEQYADKHIKIILKDKTNDYVFEKFLEKLQTVNVLKIQVVDDNRNLPNIPEDHIINEAEDTLTILRKHVDAMDVEEGDALKSILESFYNEALDNL